MAHAAYRRLAYWGVLAFLLVSSSGADAARKRSNARKTVKRAAVHYQAKRFEKALEAYKKAYRIERKSKHLFQIAQCHRKLGSFQKAIDKYKAYLKKTSKGRYRQSAKRFIKECEAELAAGDEIALLAPDSIPLAPIAPIKKEKGETRAGGEESVGEIALTAPVPRKEKGEGAENRNLTTLVADPVEQESLPIVAATSIEDSGDRFYETWWFWTIVGGVVVTAAGTTAIALTTGGETREVLPVGSLGAIDFRGAR